MAAPRTSLRLKRLRERILGIKAPKMVIRTHLAWYWRFLSLIITLSVSVALGVWIFETGRWIAGFNLSESAQEVDALKAKNMALEKELLQLRSIAGTGESKLQIERTALTQLSDQVKLLEIENAGLKEDLAFFESMMPSNTGGEPGLKIDHFYVEPAVRSGTYRYRMLVAHYAGRQAKTLKINVQLILKTQQAGKAVTLNLPTESEKSGKQFNVEIKRFQRLDGEFALPAGAVLKSVEVRLLENDAVRARESVVF